MKKIWFSFLVFSLFVAQCLSQDCTLVEYIDGRVCSQCPNPNQNRCTGCNGLVPPPGESPVIFDHCGTCNGLGGTCRGCDGVYGSGQDYDECGICGGINECSKNLTDFVDFFPEDSGKNNRIYRLPLRIKMTSRSPGASIFYKFIINEGAESPLTPPNLFSIRGSEIITSSNITIKAIALIPGKRVSVVKTALYLVSETAPLEEFKETKLFPIWLIAVIVVVGSILVIFFVVLFFFFRIRYRMKMIDIRIEEHERAAKEDAYRAIFDYQPQYADELELKVGDVLLVSRKHENGWWEGRSCRLKLKEGLFPSAYVELVPPERLMWVERPKTFAGRLSHRISSMFSGVQYGTDPQLSTRNSSRLSKRVSKIVSRTINENELLPMNQELPTKPNTPLPPKPTTALPQKPNTPVPFKPYTQQQQQQQQYQQNTSMDRSVY